MHSSIWNTSKLPQSSTEYQEDDQCDLRSDDLRQENNILRQELSILYTKFLTSHIEQHKKEFKDNECQTDDAALFKIPVVVEKFNNITSELSHQRALNAEQAKREKESDRKIHSLELKILDMNMEILQAAPIKTKIEELTALTEQQQTKLSSATNEYLNLTVEVNHYKSNIESLNKQLNEKSDTIAGLLSQVTHLEEKLTEVRKQVGHKESQLEAALFLNTEYQAKLHKDDLQLMKVSGELNHYERKCESQSKDILRLADSLNTTKLQLQQVTKDLNAAKADNKEHGNATGTEHKREKESPAAAMGYAHNRAASAVPTSSPSTSTNRTSWSSNASSNATQAHNRANTTGTSIAGTSAAGSPPSIARTRKDFTETLDVEDCVCPDFSFFTTSSSHDSKRTSSTSYNRKNTFQYYN